MNKTRTIVLLLSIGLFLAGCGGDDDRSGRRGQKDPGAAPPIALPPPADTDPAYLVFSEEPLAEESLHSLDEIPGLAVAASASIGEMPVTGPEGAVTMRVAAVDPLEFRPVAPTSSRDAEFVWSEMASGEAIVTFAGADELALGDGQSIRVNDSSLVVGAYADNGVPNIADVMVNESVGEDLGLDEPRWVAVGAKPGADLERLGKALQNRLPDAHIAGLLPDPPDVIDPGDPEAVGEASGSLIGTMEFKILDDGFIKPNKEWVQENIATGEVALIGEVTCHRLLIPQFQAAMNEIVEADLAELIRPDDYGGCYVPRFIDRDPSLPLSMHAFGLAFDINVSTNLLGTKGDLDPRVVEIFEKWGFAWGGRWDRPDPMHFELARIVQP
ncbi:MAG: M15 family metallopeptidase [Actinomycetota bacterium]|nr:M15 family metallopeptidase [Actinomycetota bacterium]